MNRNRDIGVVDESWCRKHAMRVGQTMSALPVTPHTRIP